MNKQISIQINQLTKSFKQTKALNNISLNFDSGLLHGVIGPEGAGKTTLFRLLAGLYTPTSGQINFYTNGVLTDFESVRSTVAYMPERQNLYADLSIQEHLDFFAKLYLLPDLVYQERKEKLLQITRLDKFINRPAGKLSGGMYKKLGLMCALLRSPQILLLDEPTNGVDPISRREFWELLYDLRSQNILMIVSTAYMDEAERCTQAHLLENGKIISSGLPTQLLTDFNVSNFNDLFIKQSELI